MKKNHQKDEFLMGEKQQTTIQINHLLHIIFDCYRIKRKRPPLKSFLHEKFRQEILIEAIVGNE
ncbi:CLUMA_CG016927, isoform A [Clunio marinus]|uniref:CLUMA_CG016927, isoform A n=1 Tax=Clunio marinus TaxID=568069 RepID=A0A1J1IUQ2_9DIPT|nr:CLUMA_CG016927, isoform A [Clunio marinus]